jgi:dihydrofolate reductase
VVASSLDGYIAGPQGEADWIPIDPEIDFDALFGQFDTFLLGRHTFEWMRKHGGSMLADKRVIVFSNSLRQEDHPGVTVAADPAAIVPALKAESGKDIWLFGGGVLFRALLEAGLVDTVEVAVIPILLGGGIALLPPPSSQRKLKLTGHKVYRSGIVSLDYAVV